MLQVTPVKLRGKHDNGSFTRNRRRHRVPPRQARLQVDTKSRLNNDSEKLFVSARSNFYFCVHDYSMLSCIIELISAELKKKKLIPMGFELVRPDIYEIYTKLAKSISRRCEQLDHHLRRQIKARDVFYKHIATWLSRNFLVRYLFS